MSVQAIDTGLPDDLREASNILLLSSSMGHHGDAACSALLSVDPPEHEDVLCVTLTEGPDDRIDEWRTHVGPDLPAKMSVVSIGDDERSAATAAGGDLNLPRGLTMQTVSDPRNLTDLGIRITEQLGEWEDDGNQIVVGFDSLSVLLQHASSKRVFRFLHVLKGRIDATNAIAHYHMDPAAHDESVVNTYASLMDAVVEVGEDGEWTISSR